MNKSMKIFLFFLVPILIILKTNNMLFASSSCLNISTLLRCYLESLGIESQVICGVYYITNLSFPHVFLKIGGHIIDNTYIHSGNPDNEIEDLSPDLRNLPNYVVEGPSKTRLQLRGGVADRREGMYMEVGCMNELNQRKHACSAIATNMLELWTGQSKS